MLLRTSVACVMLVLTCGCSGGDHSTGPAESPPDSDGRGWRRCVGRSFEPAAKTGWQHAQSQATALLGSPAHSAQDVIAADPSKVVIPGKFAYGDLSVDMVNERVRVYLDDCQGWRSLG